jgi:hypothetical protein
MPGFGKWYGRFTAVYSLTICSRQSDPADDRAGSEERLAEFLRYRLGVAISLSGTPRTPEVADAAHQNGAWYTTHSGILIALL